MGPLSKPPNVARRIEAALRRSLRGRRVVLAVSGGRDSMALLHAAARASRGSIAMVATFDHGTGSHASRACDHVATTAASLGLPVVIGHAVTAGRSEAEWREARLGFLADVAARARASVATAHTRDDQVETVLMRVLRGARARGLAGLFAAGGAERPLLAFTRADVNHYCAERGVTWVDDPTNESTAFLRNRVRRDLLPALLRADPALEAALLEIARRAAGWRAEVDAWAAGASRLVRGRVQVSHAALAGRTTAELAVLWPALAARVGLAMDRRGTRRAAEVTTEGRVGGRVPLSGGWEIVRSRDGFDLQRAAGAPAADTPLRPGTRWLGWTFVGDGRHGAATAGPPRASDAWVAVLPANAPLRVRAWAAGDRMRLGGDARRVKRFLSDARVTGARRQGWPVVLAGDEIVWIPGVRRSNAAAVRPGRPGVFYRCVPDR